MYAKYRYIPGASAANIINDICKLASGTTDPALLSADCDQANTSVDARFKVAGWELFDAAATLSGYSDGHVLRAPHADDPTGYKYLFLGTKDSYNPTTQIAVRPMEDWDDVGKVAVNLPTFSNVEYSRIYYAAAGGGVLHIYATDRVLFVYSVSTTYPYGGDNSNRWFMCAEHSRLDFDNVIGESPSFVCSGISWNHSYVDYMAFTRCGWRTNNYLNSGMLQGIRYGSKNECPYPRSNPMDGGEITYLFTPLMFSGMMCGTDEARRVIGGSTSELEDVWLTRMSSTVGDTVVINGADTYVCYPLHGGEASVTLLCRLV